jgi:hypothetical protein
MPAAQGGGVNPPFEAQHVRPVQDAEHLLIATGCASARPSACAAMNWNLDRARLWVRRLKGGLSVEQPVADDELRVGGGAKPDSERAAQPCKQHTKPRHFTRPAHSSNAAMQHYHPARDVYL